MVDRGEFTSDDHHRTHLFLPNAQDTSRTVSGSFPEQGQRNCRPRRRSNARAVLKLSRVQKTRAFRRLGLDTTVSQASVVETPSHRQQQLQNSIRIERRRKFRNVRAHVPVSMSCTRVLGKSGRATRKLSRAVLHGSGHHSNASFGGTGAEMSNFVGSLRPNKDVVVNSPGQQREAW